MKSNSEIVIDRLKKKNVRFFACDNVSEHVTPIELDLLQAEATKHFNEFLKCLLIDTENDPNSKDTAKRISKMYFREIFSGRYLEQPEATAFPNENGSKYNGMLVVKTEIRSVCAHHHQYIKGNCYIGIIPDERVIGLSKYSRLAQWVARRGSLQEELTKNILDKIVEVSGTEDVGVHMVLSHGCCEMRGLNASNSKTQTTLLSGQFHEAGVKKEFFDNILMQEASCKG